jgi:group I intron endonuclease
VGVIYLITHKVSGKKYVGLTTGGIEHRWSQHKSAARKGSPCAIHQAIRKYGQEAFTLGILEEVRGDLSCLAQAEVRWIAEQSCVSPKGYNLTLGGEFLDWSLPVIRERHAAAVKEMAATPSWREAQHDGARKRTADPEWRKNNSAALSRMHSNPEWQAQHALILSSLHSDLAWKKNHAEGISRRSAGPWLANHRAAMERLHKDQQHQEKMGAVFRVFNEAKKTAALVRDALLPPEEATRRAKRRERNRAAYWRRKTQVEA